MSEQLGYVAFLIGALYTVGLLVVLAVLGVRWFVARRGPPAPA